MCVFNFFADSPADKEWWAVHGEAAVSPPGSPEHEAGGGKDGRRGVAFDATRHILLCEELKALYVAITRARKRCFVFDELVAARQPMYDYLAQLGVAELGLDQQLQP